MEGAGGLGEWLGAGELKDLDLVKGEIKFESLDGPFFSAMQRKEGRSGMGGR